MKADSISFRGYRCFKKEWAGFETVKPINVIIGRNNAGKSNLLDLVELLCQGPLHRQGWSFRCRGVLDQEFLKPVFEESVSEGELRGNYWRDHGQHFVGKAIVWEIDGQGLPKVLEFLEGFDPKSPYGERSTNARRNMILAALGKVTHQLAGSAFRRLYADRDIRTEAVQINASLAPDGVGATNIVRRFLTSSSASFPRDIVQTNLLEGLNVVFGSDGHFAEILVRFHDEIKSGPQQDHWEVFFGEERKGLVSLSNSGSGLKTVILVLLNLLVVPHLEQRPKSEFTFAFEELENNLHPALLRRLFEYLEAYAVREKATIFLTTHSSVALDLFGASPNAQIIHVTHDGEQARTTSVAAHFDRLGVISELGARPSDLLQANGIVWVEGPSDRVYLNRWIDLFANGELKEGRHYQCAFYGGSLLARTQFVATEEAVTTFVNLLQVNPNIVVVCDGDRTAATGEGSDLKDRVRRIESEVRKIPGAHMWITEAKEIESYVPGAVLGSVYNLPVVPDPAQYDVIFPSENAGKVGDSFVEKHLNRKSVDKIELAIQAAPQMDRQLMDGRFDLMGQMSTIVEAIRRWNN